MGTYHLYQNYYFDSSWCVFIINSVFLFAFFGCDYIAVAKRFVRVRNYVLLNLEEIEVHGSALINNKLKCNCEFFFWHKIHTYRNDPSQNRTRYKYTQMISKRRSSSSWILSIDAISQHLNKWTHHLHQRIIIDQRRIIFLVRKSL